MIKTVPTQAGLIKLLKDRLGFNLNLKASFLIMQPFWKDKGVGLKKDEIERGVYVFLTKDNLPYDGNVWYAQGVEDNITKYWNQNYNKYIIPLDKIQMYMVKIELEEKTNWVPAIHTLPNVESTPKVEEVPIKKTFGSVTYRKRNSDLTIKTDNEGEIDSIIIMEDKVIDATTGQVEGLNNQEFSDLVDLFIEAKKDLEKFKSKI